jgi:hypothetical protein
MKESTDLDEGIQSAMSEYLHLLTEAGVPPNALLLKIGTLCSIMRNLSIEKRLVKNTRVLIKQFRENSIKVQLLDLAQTEHWLPRITFEFQPEGCPWTIVRRQFPLRPAYATTFNSCQGLTLDRVVVDLRSPVFAHGQLYTALSRCRKKDYCKILVESEDNASEVVNIVSASLLS